MNLFGSNAIRCFPSNYRPISNLPFIAEVIEKPVFNQLSNFLNSIGLFGKFQSGFQSHIHRHKIEHWLRQGVSCGLIGSKCCVWHSGSQFTAEQVGNLGRAQRNSPGLVQVLLGGAEIFCGHWKLWIQLSGYDIWSTWRVSHWTPSFQPIFADFGLNFPELKC